jgi:hypothetical protein
MVFTEQYVERICKGLAVVLLLTGFTKITAAFTDARALLALDPLFLLPNRVVFLQIGTLEAAIAVAQFLRLPLAARLLCLLWLSWCFCLYHITSLLAGVPGTCPCWGYLISWNPWLSTHGRMLSFAFSICVFGFSAFAYAKLRKSTDAIGQSINA